MKNNAWKVFFGLSVLVMLAAMVAASPNGASGGFALVARPSAEAISITGPTAVYNVSVVPASAGFSGRIALRCAADSPRASCEVSPASVIIGPGDPPVAQATLRASANATGNYHIAVTGTSGSASSSALVTLLVH